MGISITGTLTEPTAALTLVLAVDLLGASRDAVLVPAAVSLLGRGHVAGEYTNPSRTGVVTWGYGIGEWRDGSCENGGCGEQQSC